MTGRETWERRHRQHAAPGAPSAFVCAAVRRAALAFPGGLALDLAAGAGRHTAVLADAGLRPVAVDRARAAVQRIAAEIAGARGVVAAAEALPFCASPFSAIVQTCFLDRAILPQLASLLRPGGFLVVETFLLAQHEQTGHPRREHCLAAGELERLCRSPTLGLDVEETREVDSIENPAGPCLASLCARRRSVFSS